MRDEGRSVRLKLEKASIADVRHFRLEERKFKTKFGGIFLFLPFLIQTLDTDKLADKALTLMHADAIHNLLTKEYKKRVP